MSSTIVYHFARFLGLSTAFETRYPEKVQKVREALHRKELPIIVKADVQGSIEPIVNSIKDLGAQDIKVNVLHQGTGNITESDIMLAIASQAIVIGFNVTADTAARR